jgi:diguanylate cyclase (GGDEF)-like protein/PAS domain S-box-containing protein
MTEHNGKPPSATHHITPPDAVAQAAMYRLMIENTVDLIIRYDAGRRRIYVSPSAREMLGFEPKELLGRHASELVHPDDRPEAALAFSKTGPDYPSVNLTFRGLRKDGSIIWVEGQYCYLPQDGGVLAVIRDVTDRKNAETMLAEANKTLEAANRILQALAQQDGLTGLSNRRRFDELLQDEFGRALRQTLPLSVLLLDADRFKAYNDHCGHLAGDECLRQISGVIESILRRPGDHAARYGGEEFVVLLPATGQDGALAVAEQLRQAVSALAIEHPASPERIVTVSIGVSTLAPLSTTDQPDQLIAAADQALYQAKAEGRNRVMAHATEAVTVTA